MDFYIINLKSFKQQHLYSNIIEKKCTIQIYEEIEGLLISSIN